MLPETGHLYCNANLYEEVSGECRRSLSPGWSFVMWRNSLVMSDYRFSTPRSLLKKVAKWDLAVTILNSSHIISARFVNWISPFFIFFIFLNWDEWMGVLNQLFFVTKCFVFWKVSLMFPGVGVPCLQAVTALGLAVIRRSFCRRFPQDCVLQSHTCVKWLPSKRLKGCVISKIFFL